MRSLLGLYASYDEGGESAALGECVLAKGFGPKAVAVAVVAIAVEADVAAAGDLLSDAAEVVDESGVARDAEALFFKGGPEAVGHLFLDGCGREDRLDFPAEALLGFLG